MPVTNKFKNFPVGRSDPAVRHLSITPSDSIDLQIRPRVLYCNTSGTVVIRDDFGIDLTYNVSAGQILPISPSRVLATGTTATVYGWL